MKICIDAHSISHPQAGGFKTYATNLIQALANIDGDNEYRFFIDRPLTTDGLFPLSPKRQVVIVSNQLPLIGAMYQEQIRLSHHIRAEHGDLAHFLSNTGPVNFNQKYVVTIHDVIALVEPQVFSGRSLRVLWQWGILQYWKMVIPKMAARANAIITVSNYEKEQIFKHLRIEKQKIFVTHLAPSSVFYPLPEHLLEQAKQHLHQEYGINRPFVLTVGFEPRKNLRRTIEAYECLSNNLQQRFPLVIVCARQVVSDVLKGEISKKNINVTVVESLNHQELLLFYNLAHVLVFPSLRESFGLPPLEAMACGTPVIASNSSSLPEILGNGALLVAPENVDAIADAMEQVLTKPELAKELRQCGLKHSRMYSWERTARETLAVYERVATMDN